MTLVASLMLVPSWKLPVSVVGSEWTDHSVRVQRDRAQEH